VTIGLPVAPDLLTIAVGKADAVSALSVSAPTVTAPQDLPKTGASESAALLALVLVALAGGTALVRRRQQV
jgi:LPXTG-motif cell wall-anchored protein